MRISSWCLSCSDPAADGLLLTPLELIDRIGVDSELPCMSPARGPPWWDDYDGHVSEGVAAELDWDLAAQAAPDDEVEQRILAVDRPSTALRRARPGFLCGLRALPKGDTWPHAVEMPIAGSGGFAVKTDDDSGRKCRHDLPDCLCS
jgi:hypothetical protein